MLKRISAFLFHFMLLAIDIGNSRTKFGIFDQKELTSKFSLKTRRKATAHAVYSQIKDSIPEGIDSIAISSVVKELRPVYEELASSYLKIQPLIADNNFDYGFSIEYFPPEDCGADRLVDAFAAVEKYDFPVIVCDFGTATTIDLVDNNQQYLGGIITPGPNTLGAALYEKTSKLPKVKFAKSEKVIGNSTITSIQSGIYYGYVGLVDGIIERMISEIDGNPKIVSTGGFANTISEGSKYVEIVEQNLLLEGLSLMDAKAKARRSHS